MANRVLASAILALGLLGGCDAVDSMKEGMAQSEAVASDLERSLGSKPQVGFNWRNGSLVNVTIEFKGTPAGKTLDEVDNAAKTAVKKAFPQMPKKIVLAFDIDAS